MMEGDAPLRSEEESLHHTDQGGAPLKVVLERRTSGRGLSLARRHQELRSDSGEEDFSCGD